MLDRTNYSTWSAQLTTMIRVNELLDYVEGKVTLESSANIHQDQLILILPQIASELFHILSKRSLPSD